MVYRLYVEKKEEFRHEATSLYSDIKTFLGIKNLKKVRLINRYDVENVDKELFEYAKNTVFSEPQVDDYYDVLDVNDGYVFAVEYLPGQFDQRADSCSQCLQLISQKERPICRTAKIYVLYGDLTEKDIAEIKKHVINPVESRQATLDTFDTLKTNFDIPSKVQTLDGFIHLDKNGLSDFVKNYGLAMDIDDITFCQQYFK
ncbi:MAG: phosphoribosylformylglycinamidine synthase, partial [Clostridia bacterium]|nr:phosphoribosylformylglycinamidine synthase [Clostridia bacterium]